MERFARQRSSRALMPAGLTLALAALVSLPWNWASAGQAPGPPDGMVLVAAGSFEMGSKSGHPDERPVHARRVTAFRMDRTEVTNRQFAAFVQATGYLTGAERDGGCWGYVQGAEDFDYLEGASWRHPEGRGSDIADRLDHPVVCVTWDDAVAFASWAGKRLPTEAEWEFAARSGSEAHSVASAGGHRAPEHERRVAANVWQGTWPLENRLEDGWLYTAPAGSFPANALGLVDMVGNVWEWTADWYASDAYSTAQTLGTRGPLTGEMRVARGGSWFCSANYCAAYNTHFRGASPPDRAFNNVGFRCAADVTETTDHHPSGEHR